MQSVKILNLDCFKYKFLPIRSIFISNQYNNKSQEFFFIYTLAIVVDVNRTKCQCACFFDKYMNQIVKRIYMKCIYTTSSPLF